MNVENNQDELKIVSWNARTASIKVGAGNVNKAQWLRYATGPEVICLQETFTNEGIVGYINFGGLKRFAPGKKLEDRKEALKVKLENDDYVPCVATYVKESMKAEIVVKAELRVAVILHLGYTKVLVYNSYIKPKTALGMPTRVKAEI